MHCQDVVASATNYVYNINTEGGMNMLLPDKDIVALTTIIRKINIWKNDKAAPYGISVAQVPVIILACKKPGISQYEVVEEVGLEKSVVAKTIGKLMEAGYLTREQNPKDKRAFNLYPTEKSLNIYPVLVSQGQKCKELLTIGFSDEEKLLLSELLERMVENATTMFE